MIIIGKLLNWQENSVPQRVAPAAFGTLAFTNFNGFAKVRAVAAKRPIGNSREKGNMRGLVPSEGTEVDKVLAEPDSTSLTQQNSPIAL